MGENRRRKKRTNEQEYVRHLLFTVLSRGTVERVLRQLRKLPWPASQPYVLKCVLKVCKGKYAQLALAASLVAGLARYHSAVGVALVDLLLEEIRVGMEEHGSPIFGSQRRVAQLRLLGELYNYKLVDHKVCVCVCVRASSARCGAPPARSPTHAPGVHVFVGVSECEASAGVVRGSRTTRAVRKGRRCSLT